MPRSAAPAARNHPAVPRARAPGRPPAGAAVTAAGPPAGPTWQEFERRGPGALGLARLIGQVEQIVGESGPPDAEPGFDAARWVADFLAHPHPALGGRRPGDLMDTADGRTVVSDLVAQMQSGAYA